jgi:hypothetical protein
VAIDKTCYDFYPNQTFPFFPNQILKRTINLLFIDWLLYTRRFDRKENGEVVKCTVCGPLMSLIREFSIKEKLK